MKIKTKENLPITKYKFCLLKYYKIKVGSFFKQKMCKENKFCIFNKKNEQP